LIDVFRRLFIVLALAGAWLAAPAAAAPVGTSKLTLSFDGFLADGAGLFSAAFKEEMQERLARLEKRAGVSVVLVTAPGLEGADSGKLAASVGEKLQEIGKIGEHWVVLLLVPADRVFSASLSFQDSAAAEALRSMEDEQKLEIGRNMARVFSQAVTPHFKADQWQGGMRAGVEALEDYIDDTSNAESSHDVDDERGPAT
jgi:uncharacterized membrane protein YgcG